MRLLLDPNADYKGYTPQEVLVLYCLINGVEEFNKIRDGLVSKGAIRKNVFGQHVLAPTTVDQLRNIFNTTIDAPKNDRAELAKRLKALYPTGMKDGKYPWAESIPMITRRLNEFDKKFNKSYTDDEIYDATQRYVNTMSGDRYMKTLKYFIFKNVTTPDTNIEFTSELVNYLEDKSLGASTESAQSGMDWTDTMV